jgi:hypothetical protein
VRLVRSTIEMYYDARSYKRQILQIYSLFNDANGNSVLWDNSE